MPLFRLPFVLACALLFVPSLEAVITGVTVHDNANGDYPTLVRQDGSLVHAVNLGHAGPDVVVNGIAFTSVEGATPQGADWAATGAATNDGLDHPGIDDLFFSELTSPGSTVLTCGNLDPAKSYLVQFLHGEPRDCCATAYSGNTLQTNLDRAVTVPPITVGNGVAAEDPPAAADVAIVTAVLSGVTSLTYIARSGPGRASAISGFQVRDLGGTPPPVTGDIPFLSELVAVGNDTHRDEDGDTPDWIELYNPTGQDLDLNGYFLTDDPADLTKWRFPATLHQAGEYLVVFASDKDRDTAGAELHANFKLASGGDFLALVAPDGATVLSSFDPAYPPQESGFSYGVGGLAPDGAAGYFATATPGAANGIVLGAPLLAPIIDPPCGSFRTPLEVTLRVRG